MVKITKARVDGSSVKLNNFGVPDKKYFTFWATPTKDSEDFFEVAVKNLRDFLAERLVFYVFSAEALKLGHVIGTSNISGSDSLYPELKEDLIQEAIQEAKDFKEKICKK